MDLTFAHIHGPFMSHVRSSPGPQLRSGDDEARHRYRATASPSGQLVGVAQERKAVRAFPLLVEPARATSHDALAGGAEARGSFAPCATATVCVAMRRCARSW